MVFILGLGYSKLLEQGLQFIISILKLSVVREWNISVDTWDTVLGNNLLLPASLEARCHFSFLLALSSVGV